MHRHEPELHHFGTRDRPQQSFHDNAISRVVRAEHTALSGWALHRGHWHRKRIVPCERVSDLWSEWM